MGALWIATNASVNSLASFHAVMGPQAVYSASLYIPIDNGYRSHHPAARWVGIDKLNMLLFLPIKLFYY